MSRRTFTLVPLLLISLALPAPSLLYAQATASGQTPRAAQTAQEFYREYQAVFAKATKIEQIVPYLAATMRAQIDSTPAAARAEMFEMVKMMGGAIRAVVIKEEKTADGVMLTATGEVPDKTKGEGRIEIVRENGAWKMKRESWNWK